MDLESLIKSVSSDECTDEIILKNYVVNVKIEGVTTDIIYKEYTNHRLIIVKQPECDTTESHSSMVATSPFSIIVLYGCRRRKIRKIVTDSIRSELKGDKAMFAYISLRFYKAKIVSALTKFILNLTSSHCNSTN